MNNLELSTSCYCANTLSKSMERNTPVRSKHSLRICWKLVSGMTGRATSVNSKIS